MKTKLSFAVTVTALFLIAITQKINAQNWLLSGNTDANNSSKLGTKKNFPLKMYTHNKERMRIDTSGNVGIGTASPWNGGTAAKIVQLSATNFPQYLLQATNTTIDNKVWRMIARNSKVFQIQTLSDAFSSEQTALQINRNANSITTVSFPSGNIGIGTASPWNGGTAAKIVQLSATNFPQYLLQATNAPTNNKVWRMIARNNNVFQIQTLSDVFGTEQTAIQINRNGNSISTVSFPSGNVGIGTISPAYNLDVTGNARFNPSSSADFIITSNTIDPILKPTQYQYGYIGTDSFPLYQTYSTLFFASSLSGYQSYSDSRIKENIKPFSNALALINQLRPITYDLTKRFFYRGENSRSNEKERTNQIGFIAQDVEKVLPQLVGSDKSGIKTVGYVGLIPVLTQAIQEQQKQIEDLKQMVETLSQKVNATNSNVQSNSIKLNNASLYQNVPNPFNNTSSVSYYIPSGFRSAQLMITDISGHALKTYSITQSGSGKQTIAGNQLTNGMYQYSLLIDGKVIDTKKMILSK
ncbi:MAG TPA: tail fiber domain-containing protein [Parafilimonas sp.]|nr:tail fiber domain-containing protein [Parafilimonas sp.]